MIKKQKIMKKVRIYIGRVVSLLGLATVLCLTAQAATLTVTKTADTSDGVCDADCSLREAIVAAAPGDTIQFATPLFASPQTITLQNAELVISKNLTITGTGANLLAISGNNASRVFFINPGINVTMSGLNVTRGNPNCSGTPVCSGAGIKNQGTLNLTNVAVTDNTSINASAGGIINEGTATLINCSITGNTGFSGGGFLNFNSTAFIINSTISGNTARDAGGLRNLTGALTIVNSTITNNTQTAGTNGGVFVQSGTVSARNSIFAGNISNTNPDFGGALTSLGNNIIGSTTGTTGTIGSDITNVNARLAPLGFYGGQTMTHALLNTSPALNAANNCVLTQTCAGYNPPLNLTADQRGAGRVGNVDIGAFELNNTANGGVFTATLPTGRQNTAYNQQITANNGAFTYSVTGGMLPNGVNLTTNLVPSAIVALTGTPTQSGIFNFTVTATDGANSNVTNYSLQILVPTAAAVSVAGRVLTADGRGVRNAVVTLIKPSGETISVRTGTFGFYRFDELAAGETYVVSAISKRFSFSPQIVTANDNVTGVDFISTELR